MFDDLATQESFCPAACAQRYRRVDLPRLNFLVELGFPKSEIFRCIFQPNNFVRVQPLYSLLSVMVPPIWLGQRQAVPESIDDQFGGSEKELHPNFVGDLFILGVSNSFSPE